MYSFFVILFLSVLSVSSYVITVFLYYGDNCFGPPFGNFTIDNGTCARLFNAGENTGFISGGDTFHGNHIGPDGNVVSDDDDGYGNVVSDDDDDSISYYSAITGDCNDDGFALNHYYDNQCRLLIPGSGDLSGINNNKCISIHSKASFKLSCTPNGIVANESCFSSKSKVYLENGTTTTIDQLKPGDSVLSTNEKFDLIYTKVFRISHHDPYDTIEYIQITTDTGQVIELSANHYLYVDRCCDINTLVLASKVKINSFLFTIFPRLSRTAVVGIERITRTGAYNVHVLSGTIIVNGLIASHFTTESAWTDNKKALLWYNTLDLVV